MQDRATVDLAVDMGLVDDKPALSSMPTAALLLRLQRRPILLLLGAADAAVDGSTERLRLGYLFHADLLPQLVRSASPGPVPAAPGHFTPGWSGPPFARGTGRDASLGGPRRDTRSRPSSGTASSSTSAESWRRPQSGTLRRRAAPACA